MRLLLIEIGLLDKNGQYAMIKVAETPGTKQIKADVAGQEGEIVNTLSSTAPLITNIVSTAPTSMSLKGDNQWSIALAHNPVFHARIKHIDIQHHYIHDEVTSGRINLQYVPISEMIADGLIKALTQAKFYIFIKQMQMS